MEEYHSFRDQLVTHIGGRGGESFGTNRRETVVEEAR